MLTNSQNPLNQPPKKVVTKVEKFQTEFGQLVELRFIELTVLENNVLRKEELFEVDPPLSDNRVPSSIQDIRQCCICLGLYHKDNIRTCPVCGRYFCISPDCRDMIKTENGDEILACAACADEANSGLVRKLWRKLWTLGD